MIDDSPLVRSWVELELYGAGYSTHAADGGVTGLAAVEWFQPDVVLCDLNMPDLNGLDVVRAMQKNHPTTPVVIYTEQQDLSGAVEALRLGACGYVLKGSGSGTLRRELDTALQYRHLRVRQRELEEANARHQQELEERVASKTREIAHLQQVRAHAEKMAALGTVVAGVGHEINNPLAVVLANLRWLSTTGEGAVPAEEKATVLREAIQCAERIQRIVVDLRRVAHPGSKNGATAVRDAVQEALTVAREQLQSGVQVDLTFSDDHAVVAVDRDALVTVASNLVVNAAHAVDGLATGRVIIAVEVEDSGTVVLKVTDNGIGIRPEHLQRVRDPFFTTKPPGHGTGLGLAMVDRIVREAGGELVIESALGEGTTITVALPEVSKTRSTARRPQPKPSPEAATH